MQVVVNDFAALRERHRGCRLEAISAFVEAFTAFEIERLARFGCELNAFHVLQIGTDEVRHSGFLACLLDPRAGHGQGALFLRAFVDACGLGLPAELLERSRVRTEFSGHEAIVDVVIYRRGELLVYVENKVQAEEGPDQIARELRDMRRHGGALRVPESRQFGVFLTPSGRRPRTGDASAWRTLSYARLSAALRDVLPQVTEPKVAFLLRDWLDAVVSWEA